MATKKIAGITIKLDADTTDLVKGLDHAARQVSGLGKTIEGVGTTLTKNLTVPIAAAAGAAVKNYAEVDKTMVLTNKTMANSADEAELLNKAMQDAASNSVYGMDEAANATLNFARAGLDAEEAASALAPAMNLAAGEGGDLDTVSAGLVATINGFGDSFGDAEHYADVFANACNNSALDIDSLSDSMSIAAPIFNAAGYSVEDAALYMGVMANAGIDAGEAANSLKTGFARLISPAKEGAEWLEKLGINVTNADGSMKDSVTIQRELHDSFSTLSESEQIAAASAIFGKNQMSKWIALINTAPEDVEELNTALQNENTTAEMADAMMNGFGGSIEKLKSTLDVLMYSLGGLIAEYLTPVIEKVQGVVDAFLALDDETKDHIIKIAGIVAAVGPVLLIIGKVVSGISSVISIASGLIAAISAISAPVLIVIGVITALIAIGVLLYKNWDEICAWAKKVKDQIVQAWNNIKEGISSAIEGIKTKVNDMKNAVSQKWDDMKNAVSQKWDAMKNATSNAMNAIKNKVEENGGGIKGVLKTAVDGYVNIWKSGFDAIDNATGGKLTALHDKIAGTIFRIKEDISLKFFEIKSTITETFDSVVDKVRHAIDTIKDIFDFNWSLPDIELPHFSVSGNFSLNPPRVPSFSIDWYKKAMNNAYMLNGATIFGAKGNTLLGGGESGSEMIIGTNKLMDMIAQAKGETVITNTFNIDAAGKDPQELAQEISFYLDMELQRTVRAFA